MPLTEANHNERISLTREQLQTVTKLVTHNQIFDLFDTERTGTIGLIYRVADSCNDGRWADRHTVHISPSGGVVQDRVEVL